AVNPHLSPHLAVAARSRLRREQSGRPAAGDMDPGLGPPRPPSRAALVLRREHLPSAPVESDPDRALDLAGAVRPARSPGRWQRAARLQRGPAGDVSAGGARHVLARATPDGSCRGGRGGGHPLRVLSLSVRSPLARAALEPLLATPHAARPPSG